MNELTLPAIPAAITLLLNLLAPYAVALVIDPVWPPLRKKLVSVAASILLTVVVIAFAAWLGAMTVPAWPALILLAIVTGQASYALVLKGAADKLAATHGVGSTPTN